MRFCVACGKQFGDDDVFCTVCGAARDEDLGSVQSPPDATPTSATTPTREIVASSFVAAAAANTPTPRPKGRQLSVLLALVLSAASVLFLTHEVTRSVSPATAALPPAASSPAGQPQSDTQPQSTPTDVDESDLPRLDASESGKLFNDVALIRSVTPRGDRLIITFDRIQDVAGRYKNVNPRLRTVATTADVVIYNPTRNEFEPVEMVEAWRVPFHVFDPNDVPKSVVRFQYDVSGLVTSIVPASES